MCIYKFITELVIPSFMDCDKTKASCPRERTGGFCLAGSKGVDDHYSIGGSLYD